MRALTRYFSYLKKSAWEFVEDDCPTMAAALAYYTLFSLPSILLILVAVVGIVFGRAAVEGQITQQISGIVGPGAAQQVQSMIQKQTQNTSGTVLGLLFGSLALLFSATTAFTQLQSALNTAWDVPPDQAGGVKNFLLKRFWSFLMLAGIGVLLLASLAINAILPMVAKTFASVPYSVVLLQALYFVVSLAIIAFLLAAIYKVLPDKQIAWREVWAGAITTAVLFVIARFLIGLYIARSGTASAFGAAGSLILIVLWIYYSSMVLLLGAEFTQVWAREHGRREAQPSPERAPAERPQRERRERPREAA
jgi:membrane protein